MAQKPSRLTYRAISLFYITMVFAITLNSVGLIVYAQLDQEFGINGVVKTGIADQDGAMATFVLPDGKILVFSESSVFNSPVRGYHLIRYNSNGTLDSAFGTNGVKTLSVPFNCCSSYISGIVRQPDGKLILLGNEIITRFNDDGTLDTTFGQNGAHYPNIQFDATDDLMSAVVLSDGKIVVGGTSSNGKVFMIRYFSNGTLDLSLNGQGYIVYPQVGAFIRLIFAQSSGKFVAFGAGTDGILVRRYNADLTVDNTFTNIGFTINQITDRRLIVLNDDSIVLAQTFQKQDTLERKHFDTKITKFSANGAVNTAFGTNGSVDVDITTAFDNNLFGLAAQSDGQLVISGVTNVQPNRTFVEGPMLSLARISPTGVINGRYLVTVSNYNGPGNVLVQPDGKILATFVIQGADDTQDLMLTRSNGVPQPNYKFKGAPFDYGNLVVGYPTLIGASKPSVFRPSTRIWYLYPEAEPYIFGLPDDIPVPADYIGDLGTELAMFRPSNGTWYIAKSFFAAAHNFVTIQWGANGDIPVQGDYDNDGKADVAVFRPSTGVWYIRHSADNSFNILQWGTNGDKPVTGDYDGDGKADVAVWRPSDGVWYVFNSSTSQPSFVHFGLEGDIPVQEDYDGDGKTDIAVWRPSTRVWYVLRSTDGGFSAVQWGLSTDFPVPGDYDRDKKTDISVFRPSEGRWYVLRSSDFGMNIYPWGFGTDVIPQGKH